MLAVQITRVPPTSIRHEPSAEPTNPGVIFTGLNSASRRPSLRRLAAMRTL